MLVERISRISRETYAESLVGMGGVFPRRSREKGEIINDRSDDVTTFFRILQRHYVPYRAGSSRTEDFERLQASDPSALTDLERAARFLHLQRTAVGGEVGSRSLGVDPLGGRFNVTKLAPVLDALHNRLAGVIIERLPWTDFIARCDRTPFYLDPPCWGREADYGVGMFDPKNCRRLVDKAGLLDLYRGSADSARQARELIISGAPAHGARVPVTNSLSGRSRSGSREQRYLEFVTKRDSGRTPAALEPHLPPQASVSGRVCEGQAPFDLAPRIDPNWFGRCAGNPIKSRTSRRFPQNLG